MLKDALVGSLLLRFQKQQQLKNHTKNLLWMPYSLPDSSVNGIFPKQEHWSVLLFPTPEYLPKPGIEPASPCICCIGRQFLYLAPHNGDMSWIHGLEGSIIKMAILSFPWCSPVIKTPCFQCRDEGSIPGQGINIPRAGWHEKKESPQSNNAI